MTGKLLKGGETMELATFAAGCFWGVEETFRHVDGVAKTAVGYTGGTLENPAYEDVCMGNTGHAEVVRLEFDPARVSYKQLLKIFFSLHDPTTLDRQGPDIGTQYRSAVFYHDQQQAVQARELKQQLTEQKVYQDPIVTEITAATTFYLAEEYHQRYFEKHGMVGCSISSNKK